MGTWGLHFDRRVGVQPTTRPRSERSGTLSHVVCGYDPARMGTAAPSTVAAAAFPEVLREWYAFEATGFTRAPGYEAGSALPAEVAEPLTWWAAWATLKDNEWSLDPSLYRPRRVPSHVVLDPADLVREILATEREIHNELEVLLRDLEAS